MHEKIPYILECIPKNYNARKIKVQLKFMIMIYDDGLMQAFIVIFITNDL